MSNGQRLLIQLHSALFGGGVAVGILGHHLIGTLMFIAAILLGALEDRWYPKTERGR